MQVPFRAIGLFGVTATLLTFVPSILAQGQVESKPKQAHPHINLSTIYEVDPSWPQRPAGVEWAAMSGVAVDREDHVWLFTRAKPPVQIYDAQGRYLRGWGSDTIQTPHLLRFAPDGHVWTADVLGHVVRQFTADGKLLKTLGTPGQPGEDASHFNKPTDMAITPAGDLFVADGYGNNRIVHFDSKGRWVKSWGKLGTAPGEFSVPHSIVVDSKGRLYVADRNNARIQVFDQSGRSLAQWQNLMVPWTITILPNDELWVAGCSPMGWRDEDLFLSCPPKDAMLMRLDTTGRVLQLWTLPVGEAGKEKPGEVNWLHAVGVDSRGNLYVGDIKGQRAQKLVRK